jgi:glyoxalase/bleomycin resistance protein/dioxygenase superfamily protein
MPAINHFCINVPDIEKAVADLRARGVKIVTEPFKLDAIGRKLAFFADPSGNLIELAEIVISRHRAEGGPSSREEKRVVTGFGHSRRFGMSAFGTLRTRILEARSRWATSGHHVLPTRAEVPAFCQTQRVHFGLWPD